ncbi:hypothetical protein A5881_002343 [Enterococcus termitis]|nr:hypothetical protein A5881_001339 [Enterococcus termitis]
MIIKEKGAKIIYTYQNDRIKKQALKSAEPTCLLVERDVASDDSIAQAFQTIHKKFDKIDGVFHAIAFANKEELDGNVIDISRSPHHS